MIKFFLYSAVKEKTANTIQTFYDGEKYNTVFVQMHCIYLQNTSSASYSFSPLFSNKSIFA